VTLPREPLRLHLQDPILEETPKAAGGHAVMLHRLEELLRAAPDLAETDPNAPDTRLWLDRVHAVLEQVAPIEAHVMRVYQRLLRDHTRRKQGAAEIFETLRRARLRAVAGARVVTRN
jgi:hypothetical protein